jgi:hypothetical protein
MNEDRTTQILLDALKQAHAEPTEQRLYKSGKLAGLFPARHGGSGEAAARALRDGLLEVVRTELRGKAAIEWVRPTPRSVEFLHQQESPLCALAELKAALQTSREGVPGWLQEIHKGFKDLAERLTEEVQRALHRLDALSDRVEQALQRLAEAEPQLPNGVASALPWASDVLAYLDHRRAAGAGDACSLPELFKALAERHAELSVTDFHAGLRRLRDRRVLRLLPFEGPAGELRQPEYALLDGTTMLYYASR